MIREASKNDFSEQHCLRIISKKYYSMLKFDAVALLWESLVGVCSKITLLSDRCAGFYQIEKFVSCTLVLKEYAAES